MNTYGGRTSPYASPMMQQQQPQPFQPAAGQQIQPGTITYTTTTDAQGRMVYHPFRAEAASYRTSQGIVSGIQWVPAEATQVLPAGAQPAGADFNETWDRGGQSYDRDAGRAARDWQKDEDKRRRKEEKEAIKRNSAIEKERMTRHRAEEKELRRARERDALRDREAEHRLSANYGNVSPFPTGGGYGAPGSDLDRQFGSMDLGAPGMHERRLSNSFSAPGAGLGAGLNVGGGGGQPGGLPRPRRLSMSVPLERAAPYDGYDNPGAYQSQSTMGNQYPPGSGAGYGNTQYGGAYPPPSPRLGATGAYPPPSPRLGGMDNIGSRPQSSPYSRPMTLGGGVYPPGHIMEGQPIPPGQVLPMGMPPGSRSHSPAPSAYSNAYSSANVGMGYGSSMRAPSPRPGTGFGQAGYGQDTRFTETPTAFTRPINRAQSFTPFERLKVQDMDDFLHVHDTPRLPPVLRTHDVSPEDWDRLMIDLSLAWRGKLNLQYQARRTPKKSSIVADLLDLWNGSFFVNRHVELVLYKGRDARSGRMAGRPEFRLPKFETEEDDWSSTTSSEDSETDDDDPERYRQYGMYGRHIEDQQRWAAEMREARKYRRKHKAEKKRRAIERKIRRKENEKKYTLWVLYTGPREYGAAGNAVGGFGVGVM